VSSYRFCRTDDIGLLVDALNRCWAPHFPGEPPMTEAAFKRSIRDLQVWCSSCMVAFAGADPIGVLIGAKRSSSTLVHRIAVHPDCVREGHGRHLLTSLSAKLSILGPPSLVAEVPDTLAVARSLFEATGYRQEAELTDYVHEPAYPVVPGIDDLAGRFAMPVSVDDLAANGLLGDPQAPSCWERSVETLTARKVELSGIALASDERIEAYALHTADGDILSFRSLVEDAGGRLAWLLAHLHGRGMATLRLRKVHPAELSADLLRALDFRAVGGHRVYRARAQAD
jgi:GNAT superfamily N-acetyltransferase